MDKIDNPGDPSLIFIIYLKFENWSVQTILRIGINDEVLTLIYKIYISMLGRGSKFSWVFNHDLNHLALLTQNNG